MTAQQTDKEKWQALLADQNIEYQIEDWSTTASYWHTVLNIKLSTGSVRRMNKSVYLVFDKNDKFTALKVSQ
jgi:hypothetical protein